MKIGFPNHSRKNVLEEIEWIGKNGLDVAGHVAWYYQMRFLV